jgi:hypothetical protein
MTKYEKNILLDEYTQIERKEVNNREKNILFVSHIELHAHHSILLFGCKISEERVTR